MVERRADSLEGPLQVLEDVVGLELDVRAVEGKIGALASLRRHAGLKIAGKLPGRKDEIAHSDRLRVIRQRLRVVRRDDGMLAVGARHIADQIDLDQRIFDQEARGSDGRSRRWYLEIFAPDLIELSEVVQIGQEHLRLDDRVEG